jgi:hypothetical protein
LVNENEVAQEVKAYKGENIDDFDNKRMGLAGLALNSLGCFLLSGG